MVHPHNVDHNVEHTVAHNVAGRRVIKRYEQNQLTPCETRLL